MKGIDRSKSLEQIENDFWGPPEYPSHLVQTIHHLRTLPLRALTIEHIRMGIGQMMSLPILVPMALEILEADPLAQGNFYPGDLLCYVLGAVDKGYAVSISDAARIDKFCVLVLERVEADGQWLPKAFRSLIQLHLERGAGFSNSH